MAEFAIDTCVDWYFRAGTFGHMALCCVFGLKPFPASTVREEDSVVSLEEQFGVINVQ